MPGSDVAHMWYKSESVFLGMFKDTVTLGVVHVKNVQII